MPKITHTPRWLTCECSECAAFRATVPNPPMLSPEELAQREAAYQEQRAYQKQVYEYQFPYGRAERSETKVIKD